MFWCGGFSSDKNRMGKESKSGGCLGWLLAIVILALVVGAIVYAVKQKMDHANDNKPSPVPGPPGAIDKKYADALKIAMQFFDVQKCTFFHFTLFSTLLGRNLLLFKDTL